MIAGRSVSFIILKTMLVLTLLLILLIYFIRNYLKLVFYWKRRNVKHIAPVPFFGSLFKLSIGLESFADMVLNLYKKFPTERYFGMYQFSTPVVFLRDLDLIKMVTIKEFDSFVDHSTLFKEDVDPLWGRNLFATRGERWRDLRQTMSPVFTSSKMKLLYKLMDDCGAKMVDYLKKQNPNTVFDTQDIFPKYAANVIASAAFGFEIDSLNDKDNEFFELTSQINDLSGFKKVKLFLSGVPTSILKFFNIKIFSDKVSNYFRKVIDETIDIREKQNIIRPDIIHLLMEARKGKMAYDENPETEMESGFATVKESSVGRSQKLIKKDISNEDITAQGLVFLFGGFDTTSVLISFLTYETYVNQDVQDKLREEMLRTLKENDGKMNYNALLGMKYLDMVISETLRLWSNAQFIDRVCTKEFTIEPERPNEKALHLKPGDRLWIPIYAIHRDPEYYENPDKFDPERFNDENKLNIKSSSYLPFGAGPRNCIGSRFALLEAKIVLYHILINFKIIPSKDTVIPLVLSKKHLNLTPVDGFKFTLEPLKIE